ncbi:hypothetical protein UFOVP116_381 [uncultured Caudovirales phage]|uniref:Uncharacterized protein n=1 Tax=uncultured Caudovirales phage TaxID=2100421 RepID=A0A6J5LAH0_9CAUD|nr:hypothetical protein UFOVP116_381 [uncultured Caudovirales phage]
MHPQMFNQYKNKAKKPREINPDAPPRPTLLGHDVQLKNMQAHDIRLEQQQLDMKSEITALRSKVKNLEVTVNQLLGVMRKLR